MIIDNLHDIQEEIRRIAIRSGRNEKELTLIAVSKTVGVEQMEEALKCGIMHFGENKVQELVEKCEYFESKLSQGFQWHQIGRLQTNKVKYLIGRNILIQSLDRIELAEEISKRSLKAGIVTNVLVQVNVSGEESKAGIAPDDVRSFLIRVCELGGIQIKGLMTVAPDTKDEALIRKVFATLNKILVDIRKERIHNMVEMKYLSMGMSQDYHIAIEEGANMLRIGTAIFGRR